MGVGGLTTPCWRSRTSQEGSKQGGTHPGWVTRQVRLNYRGKVGDAKRHLHAEEQWQLLSVGEDGCE